MAEAILMALKENMEAEQKYFYDGFHITKPINEE